MNKWFNKSIAAAVTVLFSLFPLVSALAQTNESMILEEVVVTAQKRAQSVQDIGIAITAISGDNLRELNVHDGTGLAKYIPNVDIKNISGGGLPVVIVRGVGLQNFRINDSPTTSFYIDEVYQTSIASVEFSMYDLERVEVLKGPQGGLYGRNTIGGAIQVISRKPKIGAGPDGYLFAQYGSYARKQVEGGATFSLSDTVAARVSGQWVKSDDSYFRSMTGSYDSGEVDRWAGRFQVRWTPSDRADLNLKVHGGSDQSDLPLLRTIGLYKNIGNASGFGLPNVSLGLLGGLFGIPGTGLCDSILNGQGSNSSSCATLTGVTPDDYGLVDGNGARYDSATDAFRPVIDNQWFGVSLVAVFDFDNYALTSISAYDSIDYNRDNDADATPIEFQDIVYGSDIDSWQQEFRLAYVGGDTFSWLAGVNYAEDELKESTRLLGAQGVLPAFFAGATFSPQVYDQKTKAFAIYGHAEWIFAEAWNMIGELRYTDESKTFVGGQRLGFPGGSTAPFLYTDDKTSFDGFSGKLALEWMPADMLLLYGSISQGFKTGGFFGGFATSIQQLQPFKEETATAYEIGIKSDWLENRLRLNGSVFFYDRKDVQMNASQQNGSVVSIGRLQNIGDVEAKGAELDLTWLPADSLMLRLSLGYTDSEVTDSDFVVTRSIPLTGSATLEGTNTSNYSKYSANFFGRYERQVGDSLLGSVQLEYIYRSQVDLSVITNPEMENPLFREPAYSLVNLRFVLGDLDGRWNVMAFVENLTDEIYRVEARSDGLFGMRELYGPERILGANVTWYWN